MRKLSKAVNKKTGQTVYEGHQCGDCNAIYDRVPRWSCGDETFWVCGECRSIEGTWKLVWTDESGEFVASECDQDIEVAS